ncbi:hexokinase A isoform X3 [Rhodnius prolixus]
MVIGSFLKDVAGQLLFKRLLKFNSFHHKGLSQFLNNFNRIKPEIREGCKQFMIENVTLKEIMNKLLEQINLGLNHKTRAKSSVKCFNTYVQDLPTGRERGKFLALDLGGTNFRILLIKLDGRHYEMQSKIYAVPASIMTGPGVDLFDHIASCLDNFTKEHKVSNETLPLGFTFSFPVKQEGLKKGVLISWTKGFSCEGVVGQDVVEMLKVACERKMKSRISIVALLNDTTGTLMSCAWKNHNCKIGLILGTGTNACYMEKIDNIEEFDGDHTKPYVLINTEWGAFGDHGELEFITTSYDKEIDQKSVNPGKQRHEKMISGMYLGELVRLLVLKFAQDRLLFDGKTSELLKTRDNFRTEYVSNIESDKRGSFKNCKNVLEKLGIHGVSDQDCANVRYICECVTRRAAHLASAGVATLINKMNVESVTVGVDGTLYRKHPYFHDLMIDKILDLISPNVKGVYMMLSTDGSGRGAALIAAAAAGKESTRR